MVVTRRVGNNLQLFFSQDDSQHPDIVLEDYYDNENVHLIGLGENGQFYEYVPTSGDVAEYPPALTEGQSGEQVLGGEGYASADPLTASHNNFGWLPFMLLGGAAGGVAIGASGRGSSGHDSSAESVSVTLDPVADSDNDGRPEFSGTSNSPDSQVVIQLPDGTQITTQTDSEGNWYVEAPTSQPNGTVTVTVTDSAGNSGSLTEEFTDTSSPEAAVINSNDDEQISGKAEPGSTVVISDGSTGETTTVVVDENGDWSIQPNPVNEGDTDVTIVVVDPAGNVSPPSNGSRPDITPPDNINSGIVSDSVTLTDDVGAITGEIASGSVTDDARPTLSGDATTDIDHVNIYDNGELVGSAAVDADGKWSWTPEQDMADGTSHDLTVAAVDAAGNEGPQADGDWSFTVDTSTAAPEITNNTEDELAGNAEPGAVIVITDPVSDSVTSTVADADGHWSIQPNPAGVDAKDVVVEATDEAGNSNSVVIDGPGDSTPPDNQTSGLVIDSITLTDDVGAITGEIASGSVTDDARPTLSGDATADIDHVNIYDNGELVGSAAVDADGKWSWTPEQDMADGTSHDLTVAAVDAAGNEGPQADGDWSFTVDTSTAAPEITNNTEDELAGNAEPGAVIVITDPVSDSVTSTVADADGHWSIQPNPAGVDAKDVVVEATDEAGNSNSVVIDGPGDSTPPDNQTSGLVIDSITLTDDVGAITGEIASGSVTDDARPTLSGDATADIDHVNIYDNGELVGSAAVDADGKWSWTPEQDMADGTSHDLTVAAVDAAGNEGPQADGDWSFTVDTSVPDNQTSGLVADSITLTDDVGPVQGKIEDGSVTDDARPTYSGTTTADISYVNIYDSGKLIGSAAVEADGKWSWTPDSAMSSGAHALTVAAVDAAGNEGPQVSGTADAAWDFSVLTSAPAQPAIENVVDDYSQGEDADSGFLQKGQFTNDGTLTLNGTAGAGLTVIVWATDADGNRVNAGSGVADDNGRWSITTAALGEDGRYDLTATAVNAAGVSSAETGAFNVVLDTVAPEAAVAALMDAQGEVQGEVASGGVTDDRAPVLKGTAEAGATVTVYLDNSSTPAGSTVADADGNWTLALGTLTDGEHSWQVKVTDAAGNETRGERATFRLDSSSVELSIDQANDDAGSITGAVLNGGLTDDSTPELQGTAAAGAVVTISDQTGAVLGSSTANSSGVWTFAVAELADGEHVFTASVTNAAGNSSEAKFTLTVDTIAPVLPTITGMIDDVGTVQGTSTTSGGVTDDPSPTFTGKAEKGSLVTLYDGDSVLGSVRADAQGNWSYTPTTNMVDGDHSIKAVSTDAAGNISAPGAEWPFKLDTSTAAPEITNNTEDELAGNAEPGAVIVITDPVSDSVTSTVADADGHWSIQPNPAGVDAKDVVVEATDEAGNSNSVVIDGPGDSTPPDNQTSGLVIDSITLTDDVGAITGEIASGSVTDDARPTLSGDATADIDHVNIYDNGELVGSAAVDADGKWSWTPEQDMADGTSHDLTVAAVDAAGNEGPQADGDWSFTVDTSVPDNQTSGLVADSITLTDDVGPVQGKIEDGSVTDDARPTYSGTTTADISYVNIYDSGKLIGSAAVEADGKWSWTPDSAMSSGAHALTVAAVDAAGNEGPQVSGTADAAWDFSVLTSAPAQPAIENVVDDYSQGEDADSGFLQKGQFTNDGTLTLNGTAGAGLTVIVWATDADGNRVNAGSGVADDNGRWSITTAALGEDGRYDLTATAVNAAGVSSAETGAFNVVLDTVAPEAAVAALMDAQGEVQGEVASGGVTDDRAPVLKGTAEAGATVTVYLDDSSTPAGSTVADADGNWTLALGTLTDGEHSWQVKVTDAAGNETRGERATFRLDSSSVELSIDQANDDAGSITGAVLNGGLTDDSTPELQGTAAAGAVVTISDQSGAVLGSSTANSSGVWTFAVAELADGEHVFTASVTNAAGNSSEAKFTLNVDTTPPEPVIIQSLQDDVGTLQFTSPVAGNVIDDPAPTFTGKAEKGSLVTLYDNGILLATVTADALGEWSYTPTTNLLEGTHGITATATDAAGNVSEISSSWDFIIDITAPNVGISGNSEESLSGVTEPGVVVVIVDKNGTEYSVVADQQGKWVIAPNPISAGESGEIYAIDPAGNKGDTVAFQGSALATYSLLNESMQVNTTTTGDQLNPSTTRLADGRIVVTWQGAGVSGTEVYMQLFEADGIRKIGTEQQVNQRTANNQDSPQVIALTDGGFLIVYESNVNGLDNSGDGVMARRYGADGQAVTDEFQVNTTYSGAQNRPGAMATADGGYIISWEDQGTGIVQRSYGADNQPVTGEVTVATGKGMGSSGGPEMAAFTDAAHGGMYVTVWNATSGPGDTSGSGVVGQIFAADGTPLGGNFQVNTTTDSSQNYPDVITLNDGSIVVFWDSSDSGTSGSDIRAVHYRVDAATGTLTLVGSGDFIVNSYTSGKQYKPVGVALDDGGYLLIWGSEGGDGDGSAIYAQRFDANDNRVGREFLVNTTTSGNQGTGGDSVDATHIFDAVLTADGSVYVTWQSDNVDGSGTGIEGIVIDVDAAFYSEYTVNTTTTGAQTVSSVASLPDGGAIVVWQSASGDGSGSCVKGQLLDAKGQPVGAEFTVNTTTAGDQITPQVTVLSDGTFQVVWSTDSGAHIKGQGYTYSYDGAGNVNGLVADGTEFSVNTGTTASKLTEPAITSLEDGGYLVVWQASLNGNWAIYSRQYDANGTPVTAETVLITTSLSVNGVLGFGADWEPLPSVTLLKNGQVAIAYTVKGTGYDAGVSIYDPSLHEVTGSFVANQTLTNNQASPAVSALDNGNYVVTWDSNDTSGPDQNGYSVWGRIYAADGTALTSEFLINTATAGDQHLAKVVSRPDGSFVALFMSATDTAPGAGTSGIYAQYFDAAGNKVGQQMQIHQLTYGEQVEVDATFLAGGQLYVTWTDKGVGDGEGSAIKGRVVDLVETLGLEQMTPDNNDPTTIDYQPATTPASSDTDVLPPNVGLSTNTKETLGGQTEAGATVIVTNAAGTVYSTVADAEGVWSIVPNPLSVGENGTLSAIDAAGNQSQPVLISGAALSAYDLLNESAQVNTTTTGDQLNPSVTRLADGRIVVTWQGDGTSGTEVYMQLYEADGVHKIGTEQQVNQRTANNQDSPQVIALTDGGFLIVYESNVNGLDNSGDGVMARRYGADGQAVTDEFQVNTTYSGAQNRPGAMATADGGYIISWEDQGTGIVQRSYGADNQPVTGEVTVATGKGMGSSGGPEMAAFTDAAHGGMYVTVWNATSGPGDTSGSGVVGQIFAADGTPLGGNFQVNTTTDSSQNYPDVITLNDGSIVVFWDSSDSGTSGSDIRAVHYRVDAATGTLTLVGSGDFIVNSYTSGKQYKPVGVALDDGGYLLIWGSEGGDGDGSAIYAQRFDANDNRVGREFLVNTTTSGNQGTGGDSVDATHIFDAVLTADGSVYVTWQSDNVDGSGTGIEGIVIDVDAAFYSEYTVNTTTTGAQTVSSVASLPDGGAIVVWQSASGDGSGSCVKGQLLDAKGQPVGAEFTVNTTTAGDQITPQVTVLSDGTFQVVWSTDSGAHIKGQGYTYSYDGAGNVNGVVTNGAEYNVDSSTAASKMRVPVITSLEDGGYLVVWEASLNGNWTVYGRQYDANGTPVTAETVLATTTLNANAIIPEWEPLPSVTTLENGQVAITYAIKATGYDVGVSVYDPSTHAVTGSFVANQTLTNNQASSAVSALQNGNYVVTWDSNDTSGPDQNGYSVWGRIYAADGTALTSEFLINTTTAGDQHMARVVSQADGSFIAVFLSTTDIAPGAGTSGIYAQYFDAAGNKVGQQIQINQLTYGEQVEVDATFLAGGQLYVTWTDQGVGDGDGSAIKGRLVDLNETLGLTSETGSTHIEYQPAQYDLNGTSGNDVLDARGANSVDAKEGDDTIVINSTHFSSVKGGEGHDTLVWDSNNDLELGTVSGKISGIEAIHLGNNTAQTLFISASDVLEITKDNGSEANTLHITGDVGSSNNSNATDTVNIGKSEWTASAAQTENGVNYDVYTNNDDTTVKLLIQHGLNVI
ncbi:Ig-like domain-containing protein (plasmid) [Pantoea agglomerans]|uniref:Ig-like domain-containing protein n=2 Tax=Enterobacter agglomerans TaxID=549 RepID=UPI0022714B6C|nr:Ig-like domain-containing protein [Pantoea agglomerans]WAB89494.1 Ig-like domain-containing protein [Pantoea agglomerans]